MMDNSFEIESNRPFSQSSIWQLNREYYQTEGMKAWQVNEVPHNMTSNSMVGKTYAKIILGFLRDLSFKKKTTETVYILELGAGHGRLAFHILIHIENLAKDLGISLPPYCYVLSDIVEKNLSFFKDHTQFQSFFERGLLDFCYFDAINSTELDLRYSGKKISSQNLSQPILAISNYFFDSIPTDLFYINNKTVSACTVSLHSKKDPKSLTKNELIDHMGWEFEHQELKAPFYQDDIYNDILEDYKNELLESYLFFPKVSFQCMENVKGLSKQGAMIISMDKGFQGIKELDHKKAPELIAHGSFSIWVNYHALGQYCKKKGGDVKFPTSSTFYSQVVCLMLLDDAEEYKETEASYQNNINSFGPDDFNGIKRLTYNNISRLTLKDLIAVVRLSNYDSTFFIKVLPRIKQVMNHITMPERKRLEETMHEVWEMYFSIYEEFDLAYELGGMFYDLGFYKDALIYFKNSTDLFGEKADVFYNQALCHYQLREDEQFIAVRDKAKRLFPNYEGLSHLDQLDLNAN